MRTPSFSRCLLRKAGTLVLALALTFVTLAGVLPGAYGAEGKTYTVVVKYLDATSPKEKPLHDPKKIVIAENRDYTLESPDIEGYTLVDPSQKSVTGTATEDLQGANAIVVKYAPEQAAYRVVHWFRNADGIYLKDESATETFTAARNTAVTVVPLTRNGYQCVTEDLTLDIPTKGTAEKNLYYDRTDGKTILYFDADGGTATEKITGTAGSDITAEMTARAPGGAQAPTKAGYTFGGWVSEDSSYDVSSNKMPDHNVTLKAKWTPGKAGYTVLYKFRRFQSYLQSADGVKYKGRREYYTFGTDTFEGTVGEAAVYDPAQDPNKEYLEKQCYEYEKKEDGQIIKADGTTVVTVYYQPIEVDLTMYELYNQRADMDGDGTYTDEEVQYHEAEKNPNPKTVRVGDWISYPDEKEIIHRWWGKSFSNWVHPEWTEDTYKCDWCYDKNGIGGTETILTFPTFISTRMVEHPTATNGLTRARVEIFTYYYTEEQHDYYIRSFLWDPNGNGTFPDPKTGEANKYTPTRSAPIQRLSSGDLIWISPGSIKGYHLVGYRRSKTYYSGQGDLPEMDIYRGENYLAADPEDGSYWIRNKGVGGSQENYIEFYYMPDACTIQYMDGATVLKETKHVYEENVDLNAEYTPEVPEELAAKGYTFGGWYEAGDVTKTIRTQVTMDQGYNVYQLVAKWDGPKRRVTFDPNGGTPESIADQTVENGERAARPEDPARDGYAFLGWYYKSGSTAGARYEFDQPVTEDTELIAYWKPASEILSCRIVHQMADGTVLKTETRNVPAEDLFFSARALSTDDAVFDPVKAGLPVDAVIVPDEEVIRAVLDPAHPEKNGITFVYRPTTVYRYVVRHVLEGTNTKITKDETIDDIAILMTVVSDAVDGYTELQQYASGDPSDTTIRLYYRGSAVKPDQPAKPSAKTGPESAVRTGDDSGAGRWALCWMLSATGLLAALAAVRRKERQS